MQGLAVDEVQEFISRLALVGASEAQVQTMSDASDNPADTVADTVADTDADDRARIALLSALESLKAAAADAQGRIAVEFDRSQRQAQREAGVPSAKVGVGIAEQIALARRESPTRGSRLLGLAKALVHELPHTLAALSAGEVSEWRATIIAQATAVLSADDRQVVDARLAGRLANDVRSASAGGGDGGGIRAGPSVGGRPRGVCRDPAPRDPPSRTRHHGLPHGSAAGSPSGGGLRGAARGGRCRPSGGRRPQRRPGEGRHARGASHRPVERARRVGRDRSRDDRPRLARG